MVLHHLPVAMPNLRRLTIRNWRWFPRFKDAIIAFSPASQALNSGHKPFRGHPA